MRERVFLILALLLTASLACSVSSLLNPEPAPDANATAVAATLAALQASQPSALPPTEPSGVGSIAGNLSYPSEFIPPLRVVAVNTQTNAAFHTDTQENQQNYQIDNLPPGTYTVVAYYAEMNLAGGYSQFVPCGLKAECSDHTLINVTVTAGQVTNEVNPQDWYAPEGTFPANPVP